MEKKKASVSIDLNAVKKHHFWIVLAIVLIMALFVLWMVLEELDQKFNDGSQIINSAYSQVNSVEQELPPNSKIIAGLQEEQTKLDGQSQDAWQEFYKVQTSRLLWPAGVEEIGDDLKYDPKNPDRKKPYEIREALRASYMNNALQPAWQKIMNKANLRRPKEGQVVDNRPLGAGGPGAGGAAGQNVEYEGVVYWDPNKRQRLIDRYKTSTIPSSLRVQLTQEDIWIYDSLVDIVLKMNEGRDDPVAAVIKSIDLLEVGQPAVAHVMENAGSSLTIPGLGTADRSAGSNESLTDDQRLLIDRYLDERNKPVDPKKALDSPPFSEFRQVFVVMRFVMDQRRIPDLLAVCANNDLPIEARQVLINFVDFESKSADRRPLDNAVTAGQVERGPYDALVEVRGIVYLYNEPDKEKLGTGSAANPARRQLGVPTRLDEKDESQNFQF